MKRLILRYARAAALLFAWGCQHPDRFAGGTTDTGNAVSASVAGTAVDAEGRPVAGARVRLRLRDYLSPLPARPKASLSDFDGRTDAQGGFLIEAADAGRYRLELSVPDGDHAEMDGGPESGIAAAVDLDLPEAVPAEGNRLELGSLRMLRTAHVTGNVRLRPGSRRAYVRASGLERLSPAAESTGRFEVWLPSGRSELRFADPDCGVPCQSAAAVEAAAGSELDLGIVDLSAGADGFAAWAHSARIGIDLAGGAEPGFPLLVRFDSGVFDFSQAKADGSDVRFATEDGARDLPCEIEAWDPSAGKGIAWVRLDSAAANAAGIRVYWGNPSAANGAGGVFDSARFAAVWHLAEKGDAPHRDATANANDGLDSAAAATAFVDGIAGPGRSFAAGTAGIRIADAPSLRFGAGDFALSAWVRDAGGAGTRQVLCKRTPTADYELQLTPEGRAIGYAGTSPGIASAAGRADVADGRWHLLGLVRRGDSLALYRDGELDTAISAAGMGSSDNAADLFLGRDPGKPTGEGWVGDLDEVRVLRGAPSSAWMRLDYLTQAPDRAAPAWTGIR